MVKPEMESVADIVIVVVVSIRAVSDELIVS